MTDRLLAGTGYMMATWWLHEHRKQKIPRVPIFAKSLILLAEEVGFEPTVLCSTPDFESGTFGRSATLPTWDRFYADAIHFRVRFKVMWSVIVSAP